MKVAGYVRVSTEDQAREGISLEMQQERIKALAIAKGWELVKIYSEDGYSGKNLKRPQIQELIKASQNREIDGAVVYKIDRLTRRQRDLWYLLEDVFQKNQVALVSVTEPFDTSTAQGKAFLGMLGVFAQLWRDEIAERTQDALQQKKQNGERVGTVPYGYDLAKNRVDLVRNQQEQQVIVQMRDLRHKNFSYDQIAQELNNQGVEAKNGGDWHGRTVWGIINSVK